MPSFNLNGKRSAEGGKSAGKIYRFETQNVSTYREDIRPAADDRSTGPDEESDGFRAVYERTRKRAHNSNYPSLEDGPPASVGLLRFSVAVASFMMCLLVFTIISKDAEEEHPHHHNAMVLANHHMNNPYVFEEGTQEAVIPMGTYNNYETTRAHDNVNQNEIFDGPVEGVPSPFDDALANINDFPIDQGEIPIFWHIPRSGGTTLSTIFSECLGLTAASQVGAHGHESEQSLQVVSYGSGVMGDMKFVNVDVSTRDGIEKARQEGLVSSGLADVIVTPLIYHSMSLLSPNQKGRMFAVMRHPVERAVSEFNYLQTANWEPTYNPALANMTLLEYASGALMEDNWMVRSLTNSLQGVMSADALDQAKMVLQEKCLVGLMENYKASIHRIVDYFGWDMTILRKYPDAYACQENFIANGLNAAKKDTRVAEGSDEWNLIVQRNALDMELYDFAQHLYREQTTMPMFGL